MTSSTFPSHLYSPPSGSCQDLQPACSVAFPLNSNKAVLKCSSKSASKFFYEQDWETIKWNPISPEHEPTAHGPRWQPGIQTSWMLSPRNGGQVLPLGAGCYLSPLYSHYFDVEHDEGGRGRGRAGGESPHIHLQEQ